MFEYQFYSIEFNQTIWKKNKIKLQCLSTDDDE